MADRQGATSGTTAIRRFWPVGLVVALVCGMSAAWATEQTAETTWTGQGQYIVPVAPPQPVPEPDEPPPPVTELPTNAYDAGVLARTYELVLEEDTLLLDALAEGTGMDRDDVQAGVDAVHVLGTRVVRVSFRAATEDEARGYFEELSALVTADSPSPHLPTGNLVPLGEPTEPEISTGLAGAAPLVGGAVGLLLGWGAMLLLERLDRRVLAAADVRAVAAWPVLDGLVGDRDEAFWESVVLRARHDPQVRRVAVVTAPGARPAVVDG
ncbi:YveK family protein, partial [Cellulomonas bogoriensis]|uniref:hypothetical protein n=1 Tax=Cellulomonas bogoriensis TaxID=301388 RepID=UPI0038B8817C